MSNHLLRAGLCATILTHRSISSSAVCTKIVVLEQKLKDEIHPKIANREIVGFGLNGLATYVDRCEFPCPAIRFKEDTPEVLKLREKEKGDWKNLTLEEKKALYRASFCQTFSEINASTGEWKMFLSVILLSLAATGWIMLFVKKFVYPAPPQNLTREWQEKMLQKMLDEEQGRIMGISSKWDYEKLEWKK
uniref:Cytochrome c oxidase subunit 4 n=1 Tax=Biomphalaria glabrata TaxID=6526 RepID=A0A2C9JMD6_BIOGL